MTRAGGKFQKDYWEDEIPAGTIDGSNVTFTLAKQPAEPHAVELFLNGLFQIQGVHYNIGGTQNKTITFVTPPAPGQDLVASYVEENT